MKAQETRQSAACRHCGAALEHSFVDLGTSPLANSYLSPPDLSRMERFYPLHVFVCGECLLVQLDEFESPEEIFSDYLYFSSYSASWVEHAKRYAHAMIARFGLNTQNQVVEIASNDGYLLQFFQEKNIPVLGIEPAANVAKVAQDKGIPSLVKFFGTATAEALRAEGKQADLLLGNNVLAHVPQLNDFVQGMKGLLAPGGLITMEFPHLLRLIESNQFDTIYHEHFSYFSFFAVERVFARHGIQLFDVEQVPTHGGSLRIFGQHAGTGPHALSERVAQLKAEEAAAGLDTLAGHQNFAEKAKRVKRKLLTFLVEAAEQGKTVAGYGAPAKGNTLLNYCGVRDDLIAFTVDRSPHKQNHFLPGSRIPIYAPEHVREAQPDYLLILPWNIKDEVMEQMAYIKEWGGKFVVPIPELTVLT
jgi:SAM-dependent methyltransferase